MFRSRYTTGVALLMLLAPATLGSCVRDGVSLRIECLVVPEGDCTYTTTGLCLGQGALNMHPDLQKLQLTYSAMLRVTSGLKSRDTEVPVQSEIGRAHV